MDQRGKNPGQTKRNLEGRKDLIQHKNGSKGKNPGQTKKKIPPGA
jgi:hypothetical protein